MLEKNGGQDNPSVTNRDTSKARKEKIRLNH